MKKISRPVPVSQRSDVEPFRVMDVMTAAAEAEAAGRSVCHLEVGQPGTPAPRTALEAVRGGLNEPLGYTVALGLPALRERIAAMYTEWYGVSVDPSRVIVTPGSSGAFQLAFLALFDHGDRVAIGDPGYPSYRNILSALGVTPVRLATTIAERYQPTPARIAEAGADQPLQGVLAASPANPTGTILDRTALGALIDASHAAGACFISDEIYHGLHYGPRAVSALEVSEDAIVINSFSKYFSMTGWRVGWMVVPEALVRPVERLAQNLFICPSHVSQVAALAAFDATDELEANRVVYAANRDILLRASAEAGLRDIAPADGAFYIYATLPAETLAGGEDSLGYCGRLLAETGVAATPGLDFDPERGHTTLRFSFARGTDEVREAADRLVTWAQQSG